MARDFSKSTSNYMALPASTIGTLINGTTALSVHFWFNADTLETGAADNTLLAAFINAGATGVYCRVPTATPVFTCGAKTAGAGTLQTKIATTTVTTGAWHSAGFAAAFTGDTLTPYYEGIAEGGGAATFDNTYVQGTPTVRDLLGAAVDPPAVTSQQFDGRIAEIAIWRADIGAAGFASLALGYSPRFIRPDALIFYLDLLGRSSPEVDRVSGKVATITGSVPVAAHTRIIYPAPRTTRRFASAAPAGNKAGPLVGGRILNKALVGGGLVG